MTTYSILSDPKQIDLASGGTAAAFAEFNNGYSHIIVDDGCWVVVNGGRMSSHIFPEAIAVLKRLPDNPHEHRPWRQAVGMSDGNIEHGLSLKGGE